MEILFKNSCKRNKEFAKEFYRFYYFQRKPVIICYILLAVSFLANTASALLYQSHNIGVFIIVPLFVAFQIFSYFRQVDTMLKRDNESHGKEVEAETIVTPLFIQSTASTGAVNRIELDKIKKVVQTKNLILLWSKANLIYPFNKDSFDVGTKEEFISFLRAKGIKVKGK